jgi:hypothetical protein
MRSLDSSPTSNRGLRILVERMIGSGWLQVSSPTANRLNKQEFGLTPLPYSMINQRLIYLLYESTVPPNDAHTRCFYMTSYLGYIDLLADGRPHAKAEMSAFIRAIQCHFHRIQSACDQSAEALQVRSYYRFEESQTAARNPCPTKLLKGFSQPFTPVLAPPRLPA